MLFENYFYNLELFFKTFTILYSLQFFIFFYNYFLVIFRIILLLEIYSGLWLKERYVVVNLFLRAVKQCELFFWYVLRLMQRWTFMYPIKFSLSLFGFQAFGFRNLFLFGFISFCLGSVHSFSCFSTNLNYVSFICEFKYSFKILKVQI